MNPKIPRRKFLKKSGKYGCTAAFGLLCQSVFPSLINGSDNANLIELAVVHGDITDSVTTIFMKDADYGLLRWTRSGFYRAFFPPTDAKGKITTERTVNHYRKLII